MKKKYLNPLIDILYPEVVAQLSDASNRGTDEVGAKKGNGSFWEDEEESPSESEGWNVNP